MPVITEHVESLEEAITLVLREAQAEGMKPEVSRLFTITLDTVPRQEVRRLVTSTVNSQYGRDAGWCINDWWQVAVPWPRYEARDLPALTVETRAYLVASVEVTPERSRSSWDMVVVEQAGKPQITALPLCFLLALIDGNEDRYRIVGKDGQWTLREIAGLKQPLRLHDDFRRQLRHVLRLKPVAGWLDDFGAHGHSLAPLVVGSLLGLIYRGSGTSLPIGQQAYSREILIEIITGMGYGAARAERVLERAERELWAGMTIEEATRIVLKHIGEEV